MDWSAVTKDVRELVEDFNAIGGTELSQMKLLWRIRSFSFIHEARPKDVTPAFFMQALYSCALGHIVHDESLFSKIGGLYVLYILFETQQYDPPFLIYMSLEDLKVFHFLVQVIKTQKLETALRVVKRIFDKNMLLIGSVNLNQKQILATVDKLASQATAAVQQARIRLLSNLPLEDHLHGSLVKGMELDELSHGWKAYAQTKECVFSGLSADIVREGIEKGVKTSCKNVADELWKEVEEWESWKQGVSGASVPFSPTQAQGEKENHDMQEDDKLQSLALCGYEGQNNSRTS